MPCRFAPAAGRVLVVGLIALFIVHWFSRSEEPGPATEIRRATLPIAFEPDGARGFLARGPGGALHISAAEAALMVRGTGTVVRMRVAGAAPDARIEAIEPLPGKVNYLLGSDPSRWRSNVPTYAKVACREVYPGIDLVYHGAGGALEYDFVVSPGADPGVIRLSFEDVDEIVIEPSGDLLLRANREEVRHHKPRVHQGDETVTGAFERRGEHEVGFLLGEYDRNRPLVIDPTLAVSTYFGGSGDDFGAGITLDADGNIFFTGDTTGNDFPVENALQPQFGGGDDEAFLAKLDPTGTQLLFSTYLGGSSYDGGWEVAVDDLGFIYVTGQTNSSDFPGVRPDAAQPVHSPGTGTFVTKLTPAGDEIVWSTYYGDLGFDRGEGIAVDGDHNVYVTGPTYSTTLPGIGAHSIQPQFMGEYDGFVVKFNAAGTQVLYATFLGGSSYELARDIEVDAEGNAYVVGGTYSPDYPVANALQPNLLGIADVFLTKINPAGTALVFSTYLGGTLGDHGQTLFLDGDRNVYLTGDTTSMDFPGTSDSSIQPVYGGGGWDAFVAQVSASGDRLLFSTYLGGSGGDGGGAIGLDTAGNLYLAGFTESADFPAVNPIPTVPGSNTNAFFARINTERTALDYSTVVGGSGSEFVWKGVVGPTGIVYACGVSRSDNLPTVNAIQPEFAGGGSDAMILMVFPADRQPPAIQLLGTEGETFALCGDSVPWASGKELVLDVKATGYNPFTAIQLGAVEVVDDTPIPIPPGATFAGKSAGNPAVSTLRWKPADSEEGPRTFRFTALDGDGLESTCELTLVVTFDRDGDGLRDLFEIDGYVADNGAFVDLPGLGANVDHQDLFVYADFMRDSEWDHRPRDSAIARVVDSFAAAPIENPDGIDGIVLHVIVSPVPSQQFVANLGTGSGAGTYRWARLEGWSGPEIFFDDIKDGLLDTSGAEILRVHFPAELRSASRYCLFAHRIAELGDSGIARGAPSSDFTVSLGAFVEEIARQIDEGALPPPSDPGAPLTPPESLQAGTFMHELGHTLGLRHGGGDQTNRKPNYLSVMNYLFQMKGLARGGNVGLLDYSRAALPALDETDLDEELGLSNWPVEADGFQTAWHTLVVGASGKPLLDPAGEFQYEIHWTDAYRYGATFTVDWNSTGDVDSAALTFSINRDLASSTLTGFDDWTHIDFKGGTVGAGIPPELPAVTILEELDVEEAKEILSPAPNGLAARAGRRSVRLNWIPAGPRGEVRYHLYRRVHGSGNEPELLATTSSTLYADRKVASRTSYDYSVSVVDALGVESALSATIQVNVR